MNSRDYPSRIYLTDDEFNDTMWSADPNPFGEVDEDALEYISVEAVDKMLEEQRDLCARKSVEYLKKAAAWDCIDGVCRVCLNAKKSPAQSQAE